MFDMIILLLFPFSCVSKREIFLIFTDCRFDGSVENVLGKIQKTRPQMKVEGPQEMRVTFTV